MLYIIIGLIAGICTGLGLGGGSVLILFLVLFCNFDQHIAQATNIICFIPSAIITSIINIKHHNINFKNAFPIIIFGIFGAIIGAFISSNLNVSYLKKAFGFFLIFIAFYELYSFYKKYINKKKRYTI